MNDKNNFYVKMLYRFSKETGIFTKIMIQKDDLYMANPFIRSRHFKNPNMWMLCRYNIENGLNNKWLEFIYQKYVNSLYVLSCRFLENIAPNIISLTNDEIKLMEKYIHKYIKTRDKNKISKLRSSPYLLIELTAFNYKKTTKLYGRFNCNMFRNPFSDFLRENQYIV